MARRKLMKRAGPTGDPGRSGDSFSKISTARALGIGLELGTAIGGLALLGWFADKHFGTGPWLALIGVILGLVGGVYNVLRQVGMWRRR